MKKAVILVSGGLDSTTVLGILQKEAYEIHAISFDYNQKNRQELSIIKTNLKNFNIASHQIIPIDLNFLDKTSLVASVEVTKYNNISEVDTTLPNTYVPARNTIFLSYALSIAENINSKEIFIGVHKQDSPYPDCSPEFITAFENLANIGTSFVHSDRKIKIKAPLINMTKREIVALGIKLGINYKTTISCYKPDEHMRSCGKCLSCLVRLNAFAANNMTDPIEYAK